MTTRVIIVRHGQSSYNAQKKIQGRCDESVLTDKGRDDAQILGDSLSNLDLDAVYCSPLQRAKATAEIIHSYLKNSPPLQPLNQLMEIDLPLWENMLKQEVAEKFPEEYRCWHERPHEFKMILEGQQEHYPVLSLYEQAQQFWREILPKHEGKTILIVAHNGINRCLIMSALGIKPSYYQSIQQSNCCINVLNFTGGWGEPVQLESLNQTAHLGVKIPSYRPSHKGPRFLLIRHGETQWNRESRFQGIRDIPLNENGKKQAGQAAEFLKDIELNFAVSSPMLRPKETAEIILQYHPNIELDLQPQLIEICHGLWEGKLKTEIDQEFPGLLQQWDEKPETVQMPEGENLQDVWDRAVACWEELVKKYDDPENPQTGIVVAHDAINKVIVCYLLGLEPANFWYIKQGNGAVSVIDYLQGPGTKPVLQAINITNHLGGGVLDQTAAGAL
ncbi:histidine phosphatase family protein [Gloeothece verrucosa]|uniref:Phosphoglycerate mutase n=1 Tax=Gloeothece verrucosa (strain PCC 7822) TaxID=497965 RepID=E0U704_GLOV7|nr:histidine phosphatase family protein [Gloeothece verrucosa]ADN17160.1 Phosphoglycerate mutase [Gloeothece verrucosa PCC 7822]